MKKNEVITYGGNKELSVTPEQKQTIKSTIAVDATDEELKLFVYHCQTHGVHPLSRMIHFVKRGQGDKAKCTFQAGIDFLRSQAESSGQYDGQDPPVFERTEGKAYPDEARVSVYRKEISRPFVGVAKWKEFCPGPPNDFQWKKMPDIMLAKCAEAQALRKAFPQKLAELYTPEEMAQADHGAVTHEKLSDTVGPAGPEQAIEAEVEVVPAAGPPPAELTVQQTLHRDLLIFTGLDQEGCKRTLKEVSEFEADGNKKYITDVYKASDKWAGKALGKLRGLMEEAQITLPDACSHDPGACDHSAFTDGKAVCVQKADITCPFGIGIEY